MRKRIEIYKHSASDNQLIRQYGGSNLSSINTFENNPVRKTLAFEGCESFFNYIEWLGIAKDANPVILSSMHHYYYDTEEMKNVNTVISLKELNQVKQIKSFLHSIFHNLSYNSYFVGCFVDNSKINGFELRNNPSGFQANRHIEDIDNGIVSRNPFLNMLFSKMDLRTNKYISKNGVSALLSNHGFRVIDMTDLNGLTYFCAQRLPTTES